MFGTLPSRLPLSDLEVLIQAQWNEEQRQDTALWAERQHAFRAQCHATIQRHLHNARVLRQLGKVEPAREALEFAKRERRELRTLLAGPKECSASIQVSPRRALMRWILERPWITLVDRQGQALSERERDAFNTLIKSELDAKPRDDDENRPAFWTDRCFRLTDWAFLGLEDSEHFLWKDGSGGMTIQHCRDHIPPAFVLDSEAVEILQRRFPERAGKIDHRLIGLLVGLGVLPALTPTEGEPKIGVPISQDPGWQVVDRAEFWFSVYSGDSAGLLWQRCAVSQVHLESVHIPVWFEDFDSALDRWAALGRAPERLIARLINLFVDRKPLPDGSPLEAAAQFTCDWLAALHRRGMPPAEAVTQVLFPSEVLHPLFVVPAESPINTPVTTENSVPESEEKTDPEVNFDDLRAQVDKDVQCFLRQMTSPFSRKPDDHSLFPVRLAALSRYLRSQTMSQRVDCAIALRYAEADGAKRIRFPDGSKGYARKSIENFPKVCRPFLRMLDLAR